MKENSRVMQKGKKKAVNKPQADTIEPTLQNALTALKSAKNKQDLDTIWDGFPSFQNDPKFLDAINKRFAEIGTK